MNRRNFLSAFLPEEEVTLQDVAPRGSTTGVAQYNGQWTKKEVAHLLRRTMFGAAYSDIEYFATKTMSQAVDELLNIGTAPAPPLNNYGTVQVPDPNVAFGQTWVNAPLDTNLLTKRAFSLMAWGIGNMLNQSRTIEEKMVLFWHNHFSTELTTYQDARFGYKYISTIRQNCLGDLKVLAKAISVDPAMLVYLNGTRNTKTAPDENYARELMELFTLGKGPNSQYTEDDVKAAARVLTGYFVVPSSVSYIFNSNGHDTGNKQFSSFFNNAVITGKSGAAGEQELDELLNMIFAQQEVALYICRRLYRFFVYYEIDSAVETNVIAPMATAFRNANYNIKAPLELLFKSEHFFDAYNVGAIIKPPLDMLIGTFRESKTTFPTSSDLATQYYMWEQVAVTGGAALQQSIFVPPSVSGWPAYYQEPIFHEVWINTVTLPTRNGLTDVFIYAGITRNGFKLIMDTAAWAKQYPDADDPDKLIANMLEHVFTQPASATLKSVLKYALLFGQPNYYWTQIWQAHINDPTDTAKKKLVTDRLQNLFKYITSLEEFQLS